MTINPLAANVAVEHRRVLLQNADEYRRGKAARPAQPARASWLALRVRPIRPEDSPLLTDIFARLSPPSRLARFLYPKTTLTETELRYLTDIDHRDHEALIAIRRLRGEPVGTARFIRDRSDPTSAEVAIAVVDEWQDRGVGSLLAARLMARALRESITQFTALTSARNLSARRLLAKVGDVSVVARDGATMSYRVTLAAPAPVPPRPSRAPCARPGCA